MFIEFLGYEAVANVQCAVIAIQQYPRLQFFPARVVFPVYRFGLPLP